MCQQLIHTHTRQRIGLYIGVACQNGLRAEMAHIACRPNNLRAPTFLHHVSASVMCNFCCNATIYTLKLTVEPFLFPLCRESKSNSGVLVCMTCYCAESCHTLLCTARENHFWHASVHQSIEPFQHAYLLFWHAIGYCYSTESNSGTTLY